MALRDDEIAAAVDAAFVKLCGRSYNDEDLKRAPITHAARNGDGSHVPTDSLAQIKQDFPSLFGKSDDAS